MVDTAPPPASPVREKGYATADPSSWWLDLTHETTPELIWPLSVATFDRMRKQDAQVSSVLTAVKSPIIRTQWRVDGRGCRDEVTEFVASNLGLPIVGADPEDDHRSLLRGRDRFSWDEHLRMALLMLPFGHMFFEQVYRLDKDTQRYRIRKLGPRLPRTISKVNVAADGGLVSIMQYGLPNGSVTPIEIPVNRLVGYVLEREGGNWLGTSVLRAAYKNWLLKDRALRTWSTAVERNGVGVPFYTGAENEKDLEPGREIAEGMRAGENAGGALPYGAKMELLSVMGKLPDIHEFVQYQDEQIARSVLAHFLNLGSQTGSWALGTTFADFFTLSLQAVAVMIADTATAHIVEDLIDLNFSSTEPAPQIVFDDIGAKSSELDDLRQSAGLANDADLAEFIRTNVTDQKAA